ncbi:MAG: inositol monophosphatase family protein [Actinomycetes bacterium]|jgi:myo-inositol-1(or 4)-monophosphatase
MTSIADLALLDELREIAVTIACEAGQLASVGRLEGVVVAATKSSADDIVTEMDRRVEALLVERILAARPDDGLLGEEGAERVSTTGVRWIIDPIDGTVNYLYGIAAWGVSVAVEVDGVTVVGVIDSPDLGETYVAVLGQGARRHDARGVHELRVNEPVGIAESLIATGFGYSAERRVAQARVLSHIVRRARDTRRLGACSVDLCMVASGRVDAYYERGTHAWDYAAGGLIVTEAGGHFGGLRGAQPGEEMILAAGPALFAILDGELSRLRADSDETSDVFGPAN